MVEASVARPLGWKIIRGPCEVRPLKDHGIAVTILRVPN